jgi:hypothetical protein
MPPPVDFSRARFAPDVTVDVIQPAPTPNAVVPPTRTFPLESTKSLFTPAVESKIVKLLFPLMYKP